MEAIDKLVAQIHKTSDPDQKLKLYITAAQQSLAASKIVTDRKEQLQLKETALNLISDAESLKKQKKSMAQTEVSSAFNVAPLAKALPSQSSSHNVLDLQGPKQSRKLPVSEQKILWLSSLVNGHKFPPWTRMPDSTDFALQHNAEPFWEGYDLNLSPHQREYFSEWARSINALPPPTWFADREGMFPTMSSAKQVDLVQDTALDCSVVASLCAETSRVEKGYSSILSSTVFPFDPRKGCPALSPSGRYLFRFNFNGCFRAVEIDDRLPVSKSKRMLHIVDRNNPQLLWPALLEKAYLKVRGGYDFPGSNSNTDLWIIAGWIPEIVFLEQSSPTSIWKRMKGAFEGGDVLITVGTGKMSKAAEQELGLVGQHNYAILDLKEKDGREMVLVKNPWCEEALWTNAELTANTPPDESLPLPRPKLRERPLSRLPPSGNELAPGTFWMTLSDVFQNFESIYLNWNPDMFNHRQDMHIEWDLSTAHRSSNSLAENPQFSLSSMQGGTVWLLLCRHFRNDSKVKKSGSEGRDGVLVNFPNIGESQGESTGHISLLVFDNDGKRVYDEIGAVEQGPYVDSMQSLLRLQMPAKKRYTIAVAEQYLPAEPHNFTLIAYSTSPTKLSSVEEKYKCSTNLESAWNSINSGGSTNSPAFSINPQFKLEVYEPTPIAILLESCENDRNVNVKLCFGSGKRLFGVKRQDIVLDTYEYRKGSSFVHTKDELIEPGKYTIIASTFEAGQTGKFGLRVDSNTKVRVDQIPSEAHGKLSLQLPKAIFEGQTTKIGIHLIPLRLSNITVIVKFNSSYSPHIRNAGSSTTNISITDAVPIDSRHVRSPLRVSFQLGQGPNAEEFAVSHAGEFSDATDIGLRVFDMHIYRELSRKADLFLVIERMGKGVAGSEERYNVEILMADVDSRAVEAGRWENWEE